MCSKVYACVYRPRVTGPCSVQLSRLKFGYALVIVSPCNLMFLTAFSQKKRNTTDRGEAACWRSGGGGVGGETVNHSS